MDKSISYSLKRLHPTPCGCISLPFFPISLLILIAYAEDTGGFMFCPKCRCEYREGFSKCADCHVELIPELAPLPEPKPSDFVQYQELLSTYNLADIALIESILDSEKI